MKKLTFLVIGLAVSWLELVAQTPTKPNVKITLPDGFQTSIIAENIPRARHLAVHSSGDIYVKLERLKNGKGIIRLRDKNKDGKIDDTTGFGNYVGTGIAIKNGYLYASSNTSVYRYKINGSGEVDTTTKQTVVTGLVDKGQHNSKSITLDNAGNI